MLVLFFGILDRLNISFAAVTMNQALGLSNAAFGLAGGFFAIGYLLFGIPSTLILHRVGARRWIAVMMIAWSLASIATAFVRTPQELLWVRFTLGVAQAGLTPGIIFYISQWFPGEYRGRVFGATFFVQPITVVLCGWAASVLLNWNGLMGLAGWQWLFIVEALPTLFLAVVVVRLLPDQPGYADWLGADEKRWIEQRRELEQRNIENTGRKTAAQRVLLNPAVLALAIAYLGIGTAGSGAVFFMPLMIRSLGFSVAHTGLIAAIPAIVGALFLPLWGRWTDRARSRERVTATAFMITALGLAASAALLPSMWVLVSLTVALIGFFGCVVPFWTLPSAFLTGAGAAAGIAFINIAGNLGQFTGPTPFGMLADRTQSYSMGLLFLAASAVIAAIAVTWRKGE